MSHSSEELCRNFPDIIVASRNAASFSRLDSVESYQNDSLVFVDEQCHLDKFDSQLPAVVVTSEVLSSEIADSALCVIEVKNVRLAQALIKQHYADYDTRDAEWGAIHPNAVIHETVKLGKDVRVGPNSVIGRDVVIGDGTHIRANCVIEHEAQIGQHCVINNLVNIGYGTIIHNRVILRPGVIVGNEGFGFAQDEQRRYHRVPHTGIVEIHDDAQIGSNSNIDRGTYGKTTIARGVKIDSLCHVAHNVLVDEGALFVSQTGVAGSSHVGKRSVLSGQTGVLDHRFIADDAILVHRCGVTEDIPTAGMWAGTPPKPFKEYVRNLNLGKKVEKLNQKLNELSRKLDDLTS